MSQIELRETPRCIAVVEPLVVLPASPCCEVCGVVPVRDEEETLCSSLYAPAHQVDLA